MLRAGLHNLNTHSHMSPQPSQMLTILLIIQTRETVHTQQSAVSITLNTGVNSVAPDQINPLVGGRREWEGITNTSNQ